MSTIRSLRNRSSRYSSPATFADRETPTNPTAVQEVRNGQQTSLEKWVEPVVRNAVPSFEDTRGLERVGVLEHMAPLGAPPSQKLLQKLKVNLSRSTPRVTPVSIDDNATPPLEPTGTEVASPVDSEPLTEPPPIDDFMATSSPQRAGSARREDEEMRDVVDLSTPSPVKDRFPQIFVSPKPQSIQEHLRQDRMKNIVDRAIEIANKEAVSKLVPGLQQLFDDAKTRGSVWTILDAILNKSPTDAQFRVFKRYIKKGIRRHQSTSGIVTSPSQNSSLRRHSSPQPQSVDSLDRPSNHAQANTSIGHDSHSTSPPYYSKPVGRNSRIVMPITQQASVSPSVKIVSMAAGTILDTNGPQKLRLNPDRPRSSSLTSSTSLSSAPSDLDDYPHATENESEVHADDGGPVRLAERRQGADQVAAVSRTRSSAVNQPEPSPTYTGFPTSIRFINKRLPKSKSKGDVSVEAEQVETRRRAYLGDSFHDYNTIPRPVSSERSVAHGHPVSEESIIPHVPAPVLHPYQLLPSSATLLSPPEQQALPEIHQNGVTRKRAYDEIDAEDTDAITPLSSSPAPSLVPPPPPPPTSNIIRATTLRGGRLLAPNKARKSARVMISPNKPKNGGITAGVSRAGPGRDVGIGDGAETGSEDNDEYCASCGGEGILLCCDGCTNSFHHACLEPPLNPDDDVDGEWYCPSCFARRNKEPVQTTGLLGQVIRRVDDTIPKAFALPLEIREYFEGVRTGDEGEYEEVGLPRMPNNGAKMNRAGFFEEPNYKDLRDSKGQFITCYRCGMTSNGRDIIPCDYCPARWHTDCVDPPLAVPPRRRGGDKPTGYWRCPLHIDQDLIAAGRQAEAAPGDLGRLPRLRKPKKAVSIDICMNRGFRNNGVIEVDLMKDEMPDIKEVVHDHGIYRLPEKGIRLDFIDRVKKSWYEDRVLPLQHNAEPKVRSRLYRPGQSLLHHPPAYTVVKTKEPEFFKGAAALAIAETAKANVQLRQRSFREQSAVMSLIGLSGQDRDRASLDPLADLTNALVAEAPDDVELDINKSERDTLLKLQALINGRLALLQDGGDVTQQKPCKTSKFDEEDSSDLINGTTAQVNGDVDGDHDGDDEGDDKSFMDIT